jgi:hypothetical protein
VLARVMPTRTRSIAALLAAAAFAVPVFVSLATAVPPVRRASLGIEERAPGFAAELRGRWAVQADGVFYLLRIVLHSTDPRRLLEQEEIMFEVLPYEGPLDMEDASLAFDGTGCAYRTKPGTTLPADGLLTLRRGRSVGCAHLDGTPTGGMMLTLRLRGAKHAALRAAVRRDAPAGAVVISPFAIASPPGVLLARGTMAAPVPGQAGAKRLTLLAYVWKLSESSAWIVVLLFGAAAAIAAAVILASRPAVATFLAALALAVAYAVILPPFQGADEPNHFLTLARALERPDLAEEAAAWARRAHFEELRSAGRPFTPVDRGNPGQPWIDIAAPDAARGDGASSFWLLLAPALRDASAPRVLLTLRLFHALLFAAAAGLFVAAVGRLTTTRRPELVAIPIFLVPTLPYFGMHMSNYALLVAFYILFAAGAVVAFWDGSESHWAAPLLGLAITLGLALSRSALPLGGLAAGIVLARLLLGDRDGRWQHSVMYWALLTVTAIVGLSLANLAYPEGPERAIIRYDIAHGRLAWLLHNPWWLAVPAAALAGIEIALSKIARRLSAPSPARNSVVSVAAYMAAIALAVWVVVSPWLVHPVVIPLMSIRLTSLDETVRDIMPALLAWPRFGRPDVLTSVTFWGGFGWLEKLLPTGIVSVLAGASGLALAGLLAWVGSRRSGRALVWIACAAAGYVVSAIAYAFSARLIFVEVHGRYLLGLYLAALVIAWSVVARWSDDGGIGRSRVATSVAAACALALHAWTLTYLLGRYFF